MAMDEKPKTALKPLRFEGFSSSEFKALGFRGRGILAGLRDLHRVLEPPRRLIFLFKEPCKSAGNYVYMDGACSHADSLEPMACDTEKAVERSSRQFMFKTSRCDRSAAPETLHTDFRF